MIIQLAGLAIELGAIVVSFSAWIVQLPIDTTKPETIIFGLGVAFAAGGVVVTVNAMSRRIRDLEKDMVTKEHLDIAMLKLEKQLAQKQYAKGAGA